MTRFNTRCFYYSIFILALIAGAVVVLQFSGWSIVPFGKRYVGAYYFRDLHGHHKNYFPLGDRLIILNDTPVDSIREKGIVGVVGASRIVEYSSMVAMKQFGEQARGGATMIFGENARWLISEEENNPYWNPAMFLLHSNVPLPNRKNPGSKAILAAGEIADTLYLGTARYRYLAGDTANTVSLAPTQFFYVNGYKRSNMAERTLFIFRYGKEEAVYTNVQVSGSGAKAYFYDDRVVAFSNWVDNTVSAVAHRQKQKAEISDARLWIVNGKKMKGSEQFSRIQATSGIVTYLNGIKGVKKYGMSASMGVVMVTGRALKFFAQKPDTTDN